MPNIANASPFSPLQLSGSQIHFNLLVYKIVQARSIPCVYPRPQCRTFLVSLPLAGNAEVVSFGTGQRRREPDLLVGGLLVDHVGALVGYGNGHDAGLCVEQWLATGDWIRVKGKM